MNLRRSRIASLLAAALCAVLFLAGCDFFHQGGGGAEARVTVMTRNLYLGGDLFIVLDAENPTEAIAQATVLYNTVLATDFPARAGRLAAEIEAHDPALVGLQEATLYRTESPSDFLSNFTPDAEDVLFDFLQILQDSLAARGLNYRVASLAQGTDEELPVVLDDNSLLDVRLTDRDAILARSDVQTSGAMSKSYSDTTQYLVGGVVPVDFIRNYNKVNAAVDGVTFTFVNTHLEVGGDQAPVQEAQAQELVGDLSGVPGPVVLVGDLNSPADGSGTASYGLVTGSGFTDAFAAARPGDDGFTCCQDADLMNATSQLDERVDLVLSRGAVAAEAAEVVGNAPADKTPSGLWPSDHAGVVVRLDIEE